MFAIGLKLAGNLLSVYTNATTVEIANMGKEPETFLENVLLDGMFSREVNETECYDDLFSGYVLRPLKDVVEEVNGTHGTYGNGKNSPSNDSSNGNNGSYGDSRRGSENDKFERIERIERIDRRGSSDRGFDRRSSSDIRDNRDLGRESDSEKHRIWCDVSSSFPGSGEKTDNNSPMSLKIDSQSELTSPHSRKSDMTKNYFSTDGGDGQYSENGQRRNIHSLYSTDSQDNEDDMFYGYSNSSDGTYVLTLCFFPPPPFTSNMFIFFAFPSCEANTFPSSLILLYSYPFSLFSFSPFLIGYLFIFTIFHHFFPIRFRICYT